MTGEDDTGNSAEFNSHGCRQMSTAGHVDVWVSEWCLRSGRRSVDGFCL